MNGIYALLIAILVGIILVLVMLYRSSRITASKRKEKKDLEELEFPERFISRSDMEMVVNNEVKRSQRYGNSLTFLLIGLIDLDKKFSDLSHRKIGQLMIHVTNLLNQNLRDTDFIAQWSQNQFGILLTQTNLLGGEIVATRIKALFNSERFDDNIEIQLNIGIAEMDKSFNPDTLIIHAETAFDQAVNLGKDNIMIYKDSEKS